MQNEIVINLEVEASASKVWACLTDPDLVKQYMFGSIVHSSWKVGDPIEYTMNIEGKDMVVVNGIIKEVDVDNRLVHTLFPTGSAMEDIPENYLDIEYNISSDGSTTTLNIIQSGFESVADGEQRYKDSISGWDIILDMIKKLAEASS